MTKIIEVLGKKHASKVLSALDYKELFFNDIVKKSGVPPSTVSLRLKELEKIGLVGREELHPRAVKYRITSGGKKASKLLREIEDVYKP